MDDSKNFTVKAGARPLWKNILIAVLLTVIVLAIAGDTIALFQYHFSEKAWFNIEHDLQPIGLVIAAVIAMGVRKDMTFVLPGNDLQTRYHLGVFQYTKEEALPACDYLSVFRNSKEKFEVKLWFKGNKRIEMYTFNDRLQALEFGKQVAGKLHVDLLDATDGANRQWIEFT